MKLFWFCRIGSSDSFSRISKNVLPELYKNDIELYTSVNPTNLKDFESFKYLFKDYIVMGSSIVIDKDPFTELTFEQFKINNKNINDLGQMMKYALFQAVYYCYHNRIDKLMMSMGNYEINWFMKNIKHIKERAGFLLKYTKVVIYSPFDHIPSQGAIEYYPYADLVLTTTPIDSDLTKDYKVVGHANDSCFKRYPKESRHILIKILNEGILKDTTKIENEDIIILNANYYSKRKRIETTVDAFCSLIDKKGNKNKYKLWLHNGGKLPQNINKVPKDKLIITNPCSSEILNMIYNVCQIGLQTSWGEGWSLTNCEHAWCGGLQVVPDFMATGFHFKDLEKNRGILVPVERTIQLTEDSKEVTVGIVNVEDVVKCLELAINMSTEQREEIYKNFINYFKYTWESETNKLINFLK